MGHEGSGVAMGAIDGPKGTQLHAKVWVGDRGDYYAFADGLPQVQPPAGLS